MKTPVSPASKDVRSTKQRTHSTEAGAWHVCEDEQLRCTTPGASTEEVIWKDICFPSQGSQHGLTMLVIKETKTTTVSTSIGPKQGANEYFVKATESSAVDGCAVAPFSTRARQFLKGDSQSTAAVETAVRRAEGLIRTWKRSVAKKLKTVLDNKHVLLPWHVTHAGLIITR